ncbi:hypothetical protein C1878_13260 [Gordonibacter sp. 28C]|nr:hypothetical protein C1878_13260 [Gordonibacter sp. 28C]
MQVERGCAAGEERFMTFWSQFFEMLFLVGFGIAWPSSIVKSIRSRTAKGKSLLFLSISFCAYLCGITSKFMATSLSYVVVFYVINLCFVGTDIVLYFINSKRDKEREAQEACALGDG